MPRGIQSIVDLPLPKRFDRARLMEVKDVADWWRCSRKYIWELTKAKGEKKLPSYKVGRRRLFIYDEVYYYLKKRAA